MRVQRVEQRVQPACLHDAVLIEQHPHVAVCGPQPGVDTARKAQIDGLGDQSDLRKPLGDDGRRVIRRSVIDADDFQQSIARMREDGGETIGDDGLALPDGDDDASLH